MNSTNLSMLLFSCLAALLACKGQKKEQKTILESKNLISLQTHGCRGWCPTYQLTFQNDKNVEYEGTRSVALLGKKSFQLTNSEFSNLKTQVEKVNLWKYPEVIESTIADAPRSTMTVWKGEQQKAVTGTIDRPKPIIELETLLQDLAEAHGIQVKNGVNPNEQPKTTDRELLIQLKDDINAGNWITKFEELRFRLLRRTGASNTWVISYDPNQISESALIELLRAHPDVVSAQANNKTKERN